MNSVMEYMLLPNSRNSHGWV